MRPHLTSAARPSTFTVDAVDENGNSVLGRMALEIFASQTGLSIF